MLGQRRCQLLYGSVISTYTCCRGSSRGDVSDLTLDRLSQLAFLPKVWEDANGQSPIIFESARDA